MHVLTRRIDILAVGAPPKTLEAALADYERRIARHVRLNCLQVRGEPIERGVAQAKAREAARLQKAIAGLPGADPRTLVVCDSRGSAMSSELLAETLLGSGDLCCVVGGAAGLDESLLSAADVRLSFGPLTLPHGLARLVLVEQLYRALKIARGEPYHL